MDKIIFPKACLVADPRPDRRAFSLLELLTVIAIMAILATLMIPAVSSITGGSNLARAGQMLGDNLALARQLVSSRNREVQVLFFKIDKQWRGMQVRAMEETANGQVPVTLGRLCIFPDPIVISSNASLSPLLTADGNLRGQIDLPSYGTVEYAGFRYRVNGSLDQTITPANNFLTLVNSTRSEDPPKNYYTLQINHITGKVSSYRP